MKPSPLPDAVPTASKSPGGAVGVKRVIWLYLLLWIFEGVLRKWVAPGLSGPLLVVRDPVLLLAVVMALSARRLGYSGWWGSLMILGVLTLLISLLFLGTNPMVALFGFRANYLHFPLVFIMASTMDRDDILQIGRWILIFSLGMAPLVALQFVSPADAYVNRGAGGSESGQLETARGKIRPPGTFSFTNGMTAFAALATAFVVYQMLDKGVYNRKLWMLGIPATGIMVALSGSRGAVGQAVLVILALLIMGVFRPRYFEQIGRFFWGGVILVAVLSSAQVFQEGFNVLGERFGDKASVHEGFVVRFFKEFLYPFDAAGKAEFLGVGLGMGTNAASAMLTGQRGFVLAENDLARIVYELGPIFGFMVILWRFALGGYLVARAWQAFMEDDNALPMLLCAVALPEVLQGQLGQATSLGATVLSSGMVLAACNKHAEISGSAPMPSKKRASRPKISPLAVRPPRQSPPS
jgi:hypothetical protein